MVDMEPIAINDERIQRRGLTSGVSEIMFTSVQAHPIKPGSENVRFSILPCILPSDMGKLKTRSKKAQ